MQKEWHKCPHVRSTEYPDSEQLAMPVFGSMVSKAPLMGQNIHALDADIVYALALSKADSQESLT